MTDARAQLRRHLDALRAAGVEYVPNRPLVFESPSDPFADRRVALDLLRAEVAGCDRCPELYSTRSQTVFGVGPLSPELCFVGEAPGFEEDRQGEPFVGPAGQLLTRIINAMGFERDEVYICNTLKCRPPNNATPSDAQRTNCRPFFERQLDLIAPKYIVCLGATAAKNVLGTSLGITRLRGTWHEYRGIPVMCTFHPSYLLRDPSQKKYVWEDMKALLARMGRPVPK